MVQSSVQQTTSPKSEATAETLPTVSKGGERAKAHYVPMVLVNGIARYLESQISSKGLFVTRADLYDVARSIAQSIDSKLSQEKDQKALKPVLDNLERFNSFYSTFTGKDGSLVIETKPTDSGQASQTAAISRKEIEDLLKSIPQGRTILAALKVIDGVSLAYNFSKSPEKALFDFSAEHTGKFGRELQRYFSVDREGEISLDLKPVLGIGRELRMLGVKNFSVRSDGRFELTFGDAQKHGLFGEILIGGTKRNTQRFELSLGVKF